MLDRLIQIFKWQGGTVRQVENEIHRLKRVEQKAINRLQERIDDGCGGDFCPFCQRTFDHNPGCIFWDIPEFAHDRKMKPQDGR
jgi:peptide deformylase